MKKEDLELKKIAELMRPLNEFERRAYRLNDYLGNTGQKRVLKYISDRYQYLFAWLNNQ